MKYFKVSEIKIKGKKSFFISSKIIANYSVRDFIFSQKKRRDCLIAFPNATINIFITKSCWDSFLIQKMMG